MTSPTRRPHAATAFRILRPSPHATPAARNMPETRRTPNRTTDPTAHVSHEKRRLCRPPVSSSGVRSRQRGSNSVSLPRLGHTVAPRGLCPPPGLSGVPSQYKRRPRQDLPRHRWSLVGHSGRTCNRGSRDVGPPRLGMHRPREECLPRADARPLSYLHQASMRSRPSRSWPLRAGV